MYYECPLHGRINQPTCKAVRKTKEQIVNCLQCGKIAEQKFIIVCKNHGELSLENIKPAKNSHGACRICYKKTSNAKRNNNREAFNAKQALNRQDNPDKWDAIYKKAYQKKREIDGELHSLIKVCSARGIAVDSYFEMINAQDNKCAICNLEETCIDGRSKDKKPRRLSIDHCHKTGIVRGLLCHACNTAIGKFKDDVELLHKAIEYITKHH